MNKVNSFENDELNELAFRCINQTIESISSYTKKEYSNVVWQSFYVNILSLKLSKFKIKLILNIFKHIIDHNKDNINKQQSILLLIKTFISYQNGYLVDNVDLLVDKLCQLLNNSNDKDNRFINELFNLSKLILLSSNIKFTIDKIRYFLGKYLFLY